MSKLQPEDFAGFFRAVHHVDPFPWQARLAERVSQCGGVWPQAIDLPTASGKTACIDIAVFALACQADLALGQRTAPRRIWFVVDRRVVVDQAHRHARELVRALRDARGGVLGAVARSLLELGGGDLPLACTELRGGMLRDDSAWAASPSQPAIISSTVDQVGSRLLFRSYDATPRMAPIHAGLAGSDSLVLLDEAHCAVPFMETLQAVEALQQPRWAENAIPTPFTAVVMSATPPPHLTDVFPDAGERRAALDHSELDRRTRVPKPATLHVATRAKLPRSPAPGDHARATGALAAELLTHAKSFLRERCRKVAVMVNRVATARAVHERFRSLAEEAASEPFDVVLMTGRMRPLDRMRLERTWVPKLRAVRPEDHERPILVVATQCLEVGADFSFDALVTECASLDAIMQRFGRLNRLGEHSQPRAAIVVRGDQEKESEGDPVYGAALGRTWQWLCEHASGRGPERRVDLSVEAIHSALPSDAGRRVEAIQPLLAPVLSAPALLPAHLDCWCQTSPRPAPDPNVAVFLHGPQQAAADVSVLWRAELLDTQDDQVWLDALAICPPSSLECISAPTWEVRRWIAGGGVVGDSADIQGMREPKENAEPAESRRRVVLWRGPDASEVAADPSSVRPGDVVVVPLTDEARETAGQFGHLPEDGTGSVRFDVAEEAFQVARDRAILRLTPSVIAALPQSPAIEALAEWAEAPDRLEEQGDLSDRLEALAAVASDDWLVQAAASLARARRLVAHPAGGYALVGRQPLGRYEPADEALPDDDESNADSQVPVSLAEHSRNVRLEAERLARDCQLPEALSRDLCLAAMLHDLGKADVRFQALLRAGQVLAAEAATELLAKSPGVALSGRERRAARHRSGLPARFRHELLSAQLAELEPLLLREATDGDLVLHLVASHHGWCRPFAPLVVDHAPAAITIPWTSPPLGIVPEQRQSLAPPHRLDSGFADRFWRAVRRYGWWGLAYLEAILRLADHRASRRERERGPIHERTAEVVILEPSVPETVP